MNYVTLMIPAPSRRQAVWGALGLLALVAAYAMWSQQVLVVEPVLVTPGGAVEVSPEGVLYYSASVATDAYQPGVYRHSFTPEVTSGFLAEAAHAYAGLELGYDVMIAYQEGTEDPDAYQPVWRSREDGSVGVLQHVNGYRETDLVVSPDEQNYAYSFQEQADGDVYAIEDWSIAIHNYETGSYAVIPEATEPTWVYGGAALVYVKRDGLYMYDVETSTSVLMIEKYSNLSTADDLAGTADGKFLVLTMPSRGQVAVFREVAEEGGGQVYVEQPGVREDAARFRHPVIAPDGSFYAVVRVEDAAYNEATDRYTEAVVEVRSVEDNQVAETLTFAEVDPNSLKLEAWRW